MRAFEFYGKPGGVVQATSDDGHQRPITFRDLHDMKMRKQRREAEFAEQLPLLAAMYGDSESASEARQRKAEADAMKGELEALKKQIAVEIDAAEIDQKRKDRITQGALRAIRRGSGLQF